MIGLEQVYWVAGAMFGGIAIRSWRDRSDRKRAGTAAFWALLAVSFAFGSRIGDLANGAIVLALVILGGTRALGRGAPATTSARERGARAAARGNAIFAPALVIPLVAIVGTFALALPSWHGAPIVDPHETTLLSLALGVLVALGAAIAWLRPPLIAPLDEARRLADSIGWAVILPQLLAALGAVFAAAGVGGDVGRIATEWLPVETPFAAVAAYCVGMALFTVVMGNAFAAFPVMTAAIGIPLIVTRFAGNPAVMGSIGMLAGFCGTLATPMAANFNIVPAALLELPDRNGVIRVQIPTAIAMLIGNVALMYWFVYRR